MRFNHIEKDISDFEKIKFRNEIRVHTNIDIFIIDEFQEIDGWENGQKVLLEIFKRMKDGKIVIMTSKDISKIKLDNNLKNLIKDTISCEIPLPNEKDRIYILKEKGLGLENNTTLKRLWLEETRGKPIKIVKTLAENIVTSIKQKNEKITEDIMKIILGTNTSNSHEATPNIVSSNGSTKKTSKTCSIEEKSENYPTNQLGSESSKTELDKTYDAIAFTNSLVLETFRSSKADITFKAIVLHSKIPSKILKKKEKYNKKIHAAKGIYKDSIKIAREIAAFLMKLGKKDDGTQMDFPDIANRLEIGDSRTVKNYYQTVENMLSSNNEVYKEFIIRVEEILKKERKTPGYTANAIKQISQERKENSES